MTTWVEVKAADVKPGDRVRTPSGDELTVSRIEAPFLGRAEMIAFIEDTSDRWFKRPVPQDAKVEIRQG
jgi:hypothetical protein